MIGLILVLLILTISQKVNSEDSRVSTILVAFKIYLISLNVFQFIQLITRYRLQFLGYYTSQIIHFINIVSIIFGLMLAIYFIFYFIFKKVAERKQPLAFLLGSVLSFVFIATVSMTLNIETAWLSMVPRYPQFYYGGASQVQIDKHGTDKLLTEISFYDQKGNLVGYQYRLDDSSSTPIIEFVKYENNTLYIGDFEMIEFDLEQTDTPFIHYNQDNIETDFPSDYTYIEYGKKYKFVDL